MPDIAYYTSLVPTPADEYINTNVQPCPTAKLIQRHGPPIKAHLLSDKCKPPTNLYWKGAMVTKKVHDGSIYGTSKPKASDPPGTVYGPDGRWWDGRVTGHHCAVELLEESFRELKRVSPDLYPLIGTAGMLCVRHVRGAPGVLSNHGLGMAIDLTIGGKLDQPGDGKCQRGLLGVYAVFKKFGWYWGAEFSDEMHVECSRSVVNRWIAEGRL